MGLRYNLDWRGGKVRYREREGAARGLSLAAEHILAESRKQVPHERGDLERSGRASVDESSLTAAVSYDTVYAARQHEELTWRHDAGRKAKYLEDPLTAETAVVAAIIAAEIRRSLS